MFQRLATLALAAMLAAGSLHADSGSSPTDPAASPEQQAFQAYLDGLSQEIGDQTWKGDRPNFFGYVWDYQEPHPQFFLSLKYPMRLAWGQFYNDYRPSLNLAYTGLYDFYMGHRDSSPIVSRLQNPGLFYSMYLTKRYERPWTTPKAVEAGWWHESNGQTLEKAVEYDAFSRTNTDYAHPNDYLSRGWDYVNLNLLWTWYPRVLESYTRLNAWWEERIYTGKQGLLGDPEQDVFWGPNPRQSFINWYDGTRLRVLWESGKMDLKQPLQYWGVGVDLQAGNSPELFAGTKPVLVSARYSLTVKLWAVPLTAFYFDGWGPYLSNYMERNSLLGVGMRFW